MTTRTNPPKARNTDKEYTFKRRLTMQRKGRQLVEQLYHTLTEVLPEQLKTSVWMLAVLALGDPIAQTDTWQLDIYDTLLKLAPKEEKKLRQAKP